MIQMGETENGKFSPPKWELKQWTIGKSAKMAGSHNQNQDGRRPRNWKFNQHLLYANADGKLAQTSLWQPAYISEYHPR